MKPLLMLLALLLWVSKIDAAEFRFEHAEGATGEPNLVYDANGKATNILLTKDSDAEAHAVLFALLEREVYGTRKAEMDRGVKWEQGIIITGQFVSEAKPTPGVAPQKYRDFQMTGIKVLFPLMRWKTVAGTHPVDGIVVMETHFKFDSLFPEGIILNGKPIDLTRHLAKR